MPNTVDQIDWKTREYDPQQSRQNNSALDKDAFMRLLVTQLSNQDPLSPMEDREFIAQMAQFSSLEQMQNLNDSSKNNHEEIMEHMVHMNNNLVSSQTTIATQLTKLNLMLEAYLGTSAPVPENPDPEDAEAGNDEDEEVAEP
ncbi:flagellar hook capping FlgD N-terminal domain-containing protein [Anoxynatronum sibiricum]|uniref:Flagellar hook capping FlgD N-terminal domain-containing protein n=1 Tax=Anoxynatronum sibiricum TaxID=210623 RepID=A0ABU9VSM6_9CLOT